MAAEYLFKPYRLLREPRLVSVIYLGVYLLLAFGIGFATLVTQPVSAVDPTLVAVTGWLALTGGLFGAASLWSGVWWLERIGITLSIGGICARMVIVNNLAYPSSVWQGESALTIICLLMLARFLRIAGLALDPTK